MGEAVSGSFTVAPKAPVASILSPKEGTRVPQGTAVHLEGACFDLAGGVIRNDNAFQWSSSMDGPLGMGKILIVDDLSLGTHEIVLSVDVDGRLSALSIIVHIVADRDGDGISDEVEEAEPLLDPDNPDDAMSDQDEDGISLGSEVLRFGTDPARADTDNDGIGDGDEVAQGTNPKGDDSDGDGALDSVDNCPDIPNGGQADSDGDGLGDACDNCPGSYNVDQVDGDHDGHGDACDPCPDSDPTLPIDDTGCPWVTLPGDLDHDGDVDANDLKIFAVAFGYGQGGQNYNPEADFDADGDVDGKDLSAFIDMF